MLVDDKRFGERKSGSGRRIDFTFLKSGLGGFIQKLTVKT